MSSQNNRANKPFRMEFEIGTIKHLGLQMYSTLPPAIGEFVANAWDANATRVKITIPEQPISEDTSEIVIEDDGIGMSDSDIRHKYLIVGRDRREADGSDATAPPHNRKVMGRKGIGKFSAFGIARIIEIESVKDNEVSHLIMDYDKMIKKDKDRRYMDFPSLRPTGTLSKGTRINLKRITKYKTRSIPIRTLRRGLARRFSVIASASNFRVSINGSEISVEERDLKRLLDRDANGKPYMWPFNDEEIECGTGWKVSGWIGALNRTSPEHDNVDRGISIMARGKLVQEPFLFNAVVGQQYALSYIVGELHAEFVDQEVDTIGTSRNALVWDNEPNAKFQEWGKQQVQKIAREWSEMRSRDNLSQLKDHVQYVEFKKRAREIGNRRALGLADNLVRKAIGDNPTADPDELTQIIETSLDFLEFDSFREISEDLAKSDLNDVSKILSLFREWEIVEAKEMSRVARGRISTIEKLEELIKTNALEVPTLHQFLKEFPWVLDPRWTLVADEARYSDILRDQFPESEDVPEQDRRIDFLCVMESGNLVVVEIKRPGLKASIKDLQQIKDYVFFMQEQVDNSNDPALSHKGVVGYLLCGGLVDKRRVDLEVESLKNSGIYVRNYNDLLAMVRRMHREFIERYEKLKGLEVTST